MTIDLPLLRDTLELTLANDDTFPIGFYQKLFAGHPEVKNLFHRSSPGALHKMFAQKLIALIDHLDDPSWLDRELAKLAANHAGYGVTAEMYPWVGKALIASMRQACGAQWTEAAERAWSDAYEELSRAILAAAPRRDG